jgi:hypothetical protein
MSWVYFPNGVGSWEPGWYEVVTADYNCAEGKVDVYRGKDSNDVIKVDDEWGLCKFGFLPFKFAVKWGNYFNLLLWLAVGVTLYYILKKKKYGNK